ncbi:MAG: MFS transporter [Ruminococcaceae bacterium]|nr:MFS transporter [Oscillospiraceae bacterium]
MKTSYKRVKWACYVTNVSMSIVANFSALLFLTFRSLYGIAYWKLGMLVAINFFTQLIIDLIFSFFSHKFHIQKVVIITPLLTVIGLFLYAIWPFFFPDSIYTGLVLGTIIFSASGGFAEVLISPVIAAIPAKDPDREMSKLHSVYAWGVVGIVIFSTLFLVIFGSNHWQWLALLLLIIPLSATVLFWRAKIPYMETPGRISGVLQLMKDKTLWIFVFIIFFGGASEVTMAQWSSGYLENAFGIPKVWGDLFGVAAFSVMLGFGRSLYAKIGKNVTRVLLMGSLGAVVCYFIAAMTPNPVIGLVACAITGFCVSMLWPGSLIAASDYFPAGGVFIYAMMAAGGDFGASVGPQLVGIITDIAIAQPKLLLIAETLGMHIEQLGMKLGIFIGMFFPLAAIPLILIIKTKENEIQSL